MTEPPHLKVVPFPIANLNDIPARLRQLADLIETGDDDKFDDLTTLFIMIPQVDDYPMLFAYGDLDNGNDPIIQLSLMKQWLLNNLVQRA